MATSAELWNPLEHETVAPERSAGILVVTVEVSGDVDMSLKLYNTAPGPVPRLRLTIFPIESVEKNDTLLMSSSINIEKSVISHSRVVDSVTIQVKLASDSEQASKLRFEVPMSMIIILLYECDM